MTLLPLDSIAAVVKRHAPLDPDDVVFVSGSLTDGLGTPWSDIDVYILSNRLSEQIRSRFMDLPFETHLLDTEVWSRTEVQGIVDRLSALSGIVPSDPKSALELSATEREFCHRLLTGVPVINDEAFRSLRSSLDRSALARIVHARALIRVTNAQSDLLGFVEDEDRSGALISCGMLVQFASQALLGAAGCTHPSEKWLLRLLARHLDDASTPAGAGGREGLGDIVEKLTFPDNRWKANWREHAGRCVTFANLVVVHAQQCLAGHRPTKEPAATRFFDSIARETLETGSGEGRHRHLCLDLGVQIRWHEGEYYLLHVGDHDMIEIDPLVACIVFRFDGQHTHEEIVGAAREFSELPSDEIEQIVADLSIYLGSRRLIGIPGHSALTLAERRELSSAGRSKGTGPACAERRTALDAVGA